MLTLSNPSRLNRVARAVWLTRPTARQAHPPPPEPAALLTATHSTAFRQ